MMKNLRSTTSISWKILDPWSQSVWEKLCTTLQSRLLWTSVRSINIRLEVSWGCSSISDCSLVSTPEFFIKTVLEFTKKSISMSKIGRKVLRKAKWMDTTFYLSSWRIKSCLMTKGSFIILLHLFSLPPRPLIMLLRRSFRTSLSLRSLWRELDVSL